MATSSHDKEITLPEEESFIGRWSRRKQAVREEQTQLPQTDTATADTREPVLLTDADMPPIESLNEDSDYSGFLSPKVSDMLRKQALRKLFGSPGFNLRDGLDDYDGDYSHFEKLGDIITADMRHQMEMETRRRLEQLAEQEATEKEQQTAVASSTESDTTAVAEPLPAADESEHAAIQLDDEEVEI